MPSSDDNPDFHPTTSIQSWTESSPPVPSPNVQATMAQMTDQLQTVIDAAERAAEAIRFDAEEQARHHLDEAQRKADRMTAERVGLISELTDDLVQHAGTVRDHSEQMVRALEEAISSVTSKLEQPALSGSFPPSSEGGALDSQAALDDAQPTLPASGPTSAGMPGQTPVEADDPSPEVAPPSAPNFSGTLGSEAPVDAAPIPEDTLLHATRLAVAGNDRAAIAAALRDQHGVEDPDPVIDRVLGES